MWVGRAFTETLGRFIGEGTGTLDNPTDVAFDVVREGADGDVCFFEDRVFELLEGAVGIFCKDGDLGEDIGLSA